MANTPSRYKQMEQYMCCALLADLLIFIFYLIAAGNGIIGLKVILAILTILLSGLCLAFLYKSKELFNQRSLWMSFSAGAILICLLFSLILNFPSPNPYKQAEKDKISSSQTSEN